jgi:hypothetical protein
MKYLKTKSAITIIGKDTVIIGREDPRYEIYEKVIAGEISEFDVHRFKGDFSYDLGNFSIEYDMDTERSEIFYRGEYFTVPTEIMMWAKKGVSGGELQPETIAFFLRDAIDSDRDLQWWSERVRRLTLAPDGLITFWKKDEDEIEDAWLDKTVTNEEGLTSYENDGMVKVFVKARDLRAFSVPSDDRTEVVIDRYKVAVVTY